MQRRKWFVLTCFLSLQIFEGWKIWKCCFGGKLRVSADTVLKYSPGQLFFIERYYVQDGKWFSRSRFLTLWIFQFWKIPKCSFYNKINYLSRPQFLEIGVSILVTYVHRYTWYAIQRMVFFFTFLLSLWIFEGLRIWKCLFFDQKSMS